MKRISDKIKNNKFFLITVMSILTLILITGIQSTYAYYYEDFEEPLSVFSSLIGDFDTGNGDINIVIFKETDVDSKEFVKTYAVPTLGYSFNSTNCQSPSGQKITCEYNNPDADCNYTYNEEENEINLTSNQKVTCKFYFNKDFRTDIELYVMMQDANGTHNHNEKNYRNVDDVPAYGFTFGGFSCQNNSTRVEFENGKIKVLATKRDVCYAYFDRDLAASDIIANVYVQQAVGGLYTKVSSIPTSQNYTISQTERSYCHTPEGEETGVIPTYENNIISIEEAEQKQICEVYLDIDNSN